jgi:precorrin-2/cobalt-factor-2 C20-methyltransferase
MQKNVIMSVDHLSKDFVIRGKKLGELKQMLQKQQKDSRLEVYSVENCGMMNEKITTEVEKLDDTSGYLTIVIVKEH